MLAHHHVAFERMVSPHSEWTSERVGLHDASLRRHPFVNAELNSTAQFMLNAMQNHLVASVAK
jgi:hypothetical protein